MYGSKHPKVQGSKDQDISNSHSNTSLTLKKVHLVLPTSACLPSFHIDCLTKIDNLFYLLLDSLVIYFFRNKFDKHY